MTKKTHKKGKRARAHKRWWTEKVSERVYFALGIVAVIVLGYVVLRFSTDFAGKATEFAFRPTAGITEKFVWTMEYDYSGAEVVARDGTVLLRLPFAPGRYGQGLSFNGDTQIKLNYPEAATVLDVDLNNGANTFAFWVKPSPGGTVMSKGDVNKGWDIFVDDSGSVRFRMRVGNARTILEARTAPFTDWTHIVIVAQPPNPEYSKIYVNGQSVDVVMYPESIVSDLIYFSAPSVPPLILGAVDGGTYFKGELDDVRFFLGGLLPDDVYKLYTRGFTRALASSDIPADQSTELQLSQEVRDSGLRGITVRPAQDVAREDAFVEVGILGMSEIPAGMPEIYKTVKAFELTPSDAFRNPGPSNPLGNTGNTGVMVTLFATPAELEAVRAGTKPEDVRMFRAVTMNDGSTTWNELPMTYAEMRDANNEPVRDAQGTIVYEYTGTSLTGFSVFVLAVKVPAVPVLEVNLDDGTVPGVFGKARRFDGQGQSTDAFRAPPVDVSDTEHGQVVSTAQGDKTTVTFWMMVDGLDPNVGYMPFAFSTYTLMFYKNMFGFNTLNDDVTGIHPSALLGPDGQNGGWVHVAAVFTNGDVTSNKIYINGRAVTLDQTLNSPNLAQAVVSLDVRISGYIHPTIGQCCFFKGRVDDVKIYAGEIDAAQINEEFNKGTAELDKRYQGAPRLLAHYSFDNLNAKDDSGNWINHQGTSVVDSSGNNNHGKLYGDGGVTTDGALSGKSLWLDGQVDRVDLDIPEMASGKPISVSFFIKLQSASGAPFSFRLDGWNTYSAYFGNLASGRYFGFNTMNNDQYSLDRYNLPGGSMDNRWSHVVLVFNDGDVSRNKIYIDNKLYNRIRKGGELGTGLELRTRDGSGKLWNWSSSVAAMMRYAKIGSVIDWSKMAGLIDEVYIYEGEVTPVEIQQHYDAGVAALAAGSGVTSGGSTVGPIPDGDSDGMPDVEDNCPTVSNVGQQDSNRNRVGDVCDNTWTIVFKRGKINLTVPSLQVSLDSIDIPAGRASVAWNLNNYWFSAVSLSDQMTDFPGSGYEAKVISVGRTVNRQGIYVDEATIGIHKKNP